MQLDGTDGARRAPLAIALAIFPMGVSFLATAAGAAVALERQGYDAAAIGIAAAVGPMGTLIIGPFAARIAASFGAFRALAAAAIVMAVAVAAMGVFTSYAEWLVLRMVIGAAGGLQWILTESWLNAIVRAHERGRYLGLYGASVALGMAAGPALVAGLGAENPWMFATAGGLALVALIPLMIVRAHAPAAAEGPATGLWPVLRAAPAVAAIALAGGTLEASVYGVFVVFAAQSGVAELSALTALSVFLIGNVALQGPLGWVADRWGGRPLLLALLAAAAAGAGVLLIAAASDLTLFIHMFLWGGAVFGLYLAGLYLLGQRFTGHALTAANALFVMSYQAGGVIGPALSGLALDAGGAAGFPAFTGAAALITLVLAAVFGWGRRRAQ